MNYLEQLLAKMDDAATRAEFSGLVDKAPVVRDWIVDPDTRARHEAITHWAETEWDYDHGMSRVEWAQSQELDALRADRGKGMIEFKDIGELNEHLGRFIKDNGLVTKADYDAGIAREKDLMAQELNLMSTLATRIPYLNGKYQKDFGEMFDPDEFVSKAHEKGFAKFGKEGLDKYYDEFTAEKRTAKQAADLDARIKKERQEERDLVLKERGMGQNGQMPTLDGSPEMSHFEARIRGMNKPDPTQTSAPADAELGRGTIARFAANAADARERAQSVQ